MIILSADALEACEIQVKTDKSRIVKRTRGFIAVIAVFLVSSLTASAATASPTSQTKFGMEYFLWHCLTKGRPIYNISEYQAGHEALGPIPAFHWWGKPTAGYYCLSDNEALLRQHALELTQAGVDFIVVDFTNHDSLTYDKVNLEYLDPFMKLLDLWSKISDAPKIVPFVQVTPRGDLYAEIIRRLDQYPNLEFIYQGKPLILIVANKAVPADPTKRADLDKRFTTRLMWDDSSPAGTWMFISRCQKGFVESKGDIACKQRVAVREGKVEQVSVAAAFQRDYMSDPATAAPRYDGKTFLKQMARIDNFPSVPIVTILGWNQWIAQRHCNMLVSGHDSLCPKGGSSEVDGNPVFTDEFDQDYSNDFEPGGSMGDAYYKLLSCEIHRRKAGSKAACQLPN